jgi:hypothetical protein
VCCCKLLLQLLDNALILPSLLFLQLLLKFLELLLGCMQLLLQLFHHKATTGNTTLGLACIPLLLQLLFRSLVPLLHPLQLLLRLCKLLLQLSDLFLLSPDQSCRLFSHCCSSCCIQLQLRTASLSSCELLLQHCDLSMSDHTCSSACCRSRCSSPTCCCCQPLSSRPHSSNTCGTNGGRRCCGSASTCCCRCCEHTAEATATAIRQSLAAAPLCLLQLSLCRLQLL